MTDVINQRYGLTDEAIEAEVRRLLPVMIAWGVGDARAHPHRLLSDQEIAARRPRLFQAKASAVLEGVLPTIETEAIDEAFLRLRWDDERCGRYIDFAADHDLLPLRAHG